MTSPTPGVTGRAGAARVPLGVLDLAPVTSGGTAAEALARTLDLARHADRLGYHRYWLAEHHLASGVASSVPAVLIAAVAARTTRIRVGSGAVLLGYRTALDVAEQFGTLAALHPGRIDLGLGRSGHRARPTRPPAGGTAGPPAPPEDRVVDGLLLPRPFSFDRSDWTRPAALAALLQQPGATPEPFEDQVEAILELLGGRRRTATGEQVVSAAAAAGTPQVWLLGSSGGESAQLAGRHGLPFAANYHVSPGTVLEAVDAYRKAFEPSAELDRPHVTVSADVVVAADDEQARRLASGFGLWVLGIRTRGAAGPYPTSAEAAAHRWTDDERDLVRDRVATQFVGGPGTVVERLTTLQRVTAADELLVTTITHDHEDRLRSYTLLAEHWSRP